MREDHKSAINAESIEPQTGSSYPEPFRNQVQSRSKRALGDAFGLNSYGVNLVELQPGAWSAQRHWHTVEDEFVYVVSGELVLVTDEGEQVMAAGMVAGFPANVENGHHLVNKSDDAATYLEIGTRRPEDACHYPDIDLFLKPDGKGAHEFTRKNGIPY